MKKAISLSSAKQMRALAHPLRMRVLGELRINGPRTVGGLCDVFDEAPGNLSYHLSKLAEFGFIEEAPDLSTDRRERWWRATHEFTNIARRPDAADDEKLAMTVVRHQIIDTYSDTLHRAIDAEGSLPQEWLIPSGSADVAAYLTAEEFAEASTELEDVLMKWHGRSNSDREGARVVQLMAHAVLKP